jgi:hypothetical protein
MWQRLRAWARWRSTTLVRDAASGECRRGAPRRAQHANPPARTLAAPLRPATRAPLTATRLSPCGANRLLYIKPEAALAEALRANGLPGLLREAIALGKSGHLKRAGHCPPGQQCVRDRRLGDCLLQATRQMAEATRNFLIEGSEVAACINDDAEMLEGEIHASDHPPAPVPVAGTAPDAGPGAFFAAHT